MQGHLSKLFAAETGWKIEVCIFNYLYVCMCVYMYNIHIMDRFAAEAGREIEVCVKCRCAYIFMQVCACIYVCIIYVCMHAYTNTNMVLILYIPKNMYIYNNHSNHTYM
jgi:hypothetical protein